ncbi:CHAT domain-containing protein [Mycena maculata]|uniref:CHAT domain-containing protein n=1 Tax=Mycena maculata TaxID=230809 RepID=A0AAD7JRZ5_9AGAR|nr:CHAT domain-containing protein [Mycena maculata]
MFSQLIVEQNIFLQTVPADSDASQNSWKLEFACKVPQHARAFVIAIMRLTKSRGTRILGYIEIGRNEALICGEGKTALHLELMKVNLDGPALELEAVLSAVELSTPNMNDICGFNYNIPENQVSSLGTQTTQHLLQMFHHTTEGIQVDFLELWVMHEAILLQETADPDRGRLLIVLGHTCLKQWHKTHIVDHLSQAVCAFEDAVRDDPTASYLGHLGHALSTRYEEVGDVDDLNKCVSMREASASLTPDGDHDKPLRLEMFSSALALRFRRFGSLEDLNKSVSMLETGLGLTLVYDPNKPSRLMNLGNSLALRFERLGDVGDLNRAVSLQGEALDLAADDNLDKPMMLSNLGNSLAHRYEQLNDLEDLNKSVLMQEAAVGLTADGHPDKPIRLINLGHTLCTRFKTLGDLDDLNKSVAMTKDAVNLTPDGHQDKALRLNSLGNSLLSRFQRMGDLSDLNSAILMEETAVQLTPYGHPEKAPRLSSLGNSLLTRFRQLGDFNDLERSVTITEDAITLTADKDASMPFMFTNLGNSLLTRFDTHGDLNDLNKSVSMQETAVRLTPEGHTDRPSWLNNLGNSLYRRYQQLNNLNDLYQAIDKFSEAAGSGTGPADIRFLNTSMWAYCAQLGDHPSTLHAYNKTLEILPELAWLGLSITDRHHHLIKASSIVRNAATTAIAAGELEKAVEWLEQGRSIIWGQFLNLRTPVDVLKQKYPRFADELVFLSKQLEVAGTRQETASQVIKPGIQKSQQDITQEAHENAHKRTQLLKEIRGKEGFERFLLPKTLSELSQAAQGGPVAVLNVSGFHCDALILLPGLANEVIHVPLTGFTPEHVKNLSQSFERLVPSSGRSDRMYGHREGRLVPEEEFAYILSELWVWLVKPVLDALAITTPRREKLQRIWWCPTGPLTFLPIHAAGLYGKDDTFGSKVSDFVISSYTPTLTALIEGFRPQSQPEKKPQLLAVAQSSSTGQTYIPGTQEEIDYIQSHAYGKMSVLKLEEHNAKVESVWEGMRNSSWVHFACHGVQDFFDPTKSALLLAGREQLTLSSIINLSLPDAKFAFLSACQTATGDKKLQEESVHLAAGMLLAGYRGVIATMWTIMDNDAPQVASDVYEYLFKMSQPDPKQAAEALHLAIRRLREQSGGTKSFFHWVPYIHVGV